MTDKARIAQLMALKERKAKAALARRFNATAGEVDRAHATMNQIQSLIKERTVHEGAVVTPGTLAAQHWVGTALAGQLETVRDQSRQSEARLAALKTELSQQTARERVTQERADLARHQARAEAQEKADSQLNDRPRR